MTTHGLSLGFSLTEASASPAFDTAQSPASKHRGTMSGRNGWICGSGVNCRTHAHYLTTENDL